MPSAQHSSADDREQLFTDKPWEFGAFADGTDRWPDSVRHVACYLKHSAKFERIASTPKKMILNTFSGMAAGVGDDGQLRRTPLRHLRVWQTLLPSKEKRRDTTPT